MTVKEQHERRPIRAHGVDGTVLFLPPDTSLAPGTVVQTEDGKRWIVQGPAEPYTCHGLAYVCQEVVT